MNHVCLGGFKCLEELELHPDSIFSAHQRGVGWFGFPIHCWRSRHRSPVPSRRLRRVPNSPGGHQGGVPGHDQSHHSSSNLLI